MTEAHIDPLDLVEYARGALAPRSAAAIRAHCERCDDCGAQLAAILLVREAHGIEAPAPDRRPRMLAAAAAAAAATLLVASLALWSAFGTAASDPAPPAASVGVDGSAPTPGLTPVAADQPLPASLAGALDAVLKGVRIESGFVQSATRASEETAVVEAAERLRDGDLASAADTLRPHAGSSDPRVDLLLGITELLGGHPVAARALLERVAAEPVAAEADYTLYPRAARLFLSEALLRTGDTARAGRLLADLVDAGDSEGDWIHDAALDRLADADIATAPR